MRKRVYIELAALLVILAGMSVWQGLHSQKHEPVYHGKPLRYWLRGYRAGNWSWNQSTALMADEAVRVIGTNAIPTLLEMISASDSALDIKLLKWSYTWRRWARRQPFLRIAPIPHLPSYDALEASQAFRALGPQASVAVPDLVRLLDQDLPAMNHGHIILILADIGPPAERAVPAVLRDLHASNPIRRGNALYALGRIGAAPELVVTNAAVVLGDPDPYVRRQAARSLESFGAEARSSVPALVEALQKWSLQPAYPRRFERDPDDPIVAAQDALKAIDPEAAAKAGVK